MADAGPRHVLSVFSTFGVGGPQVRFCKVLAALGEGVVECFMRIAAIRG